jgi:hypothetical protein
MQRCPSSFVSQVDICLRDVLLPERREDKVPVCCTAFQSELVARVIVSKERIQTVPVLHRWPQKKREKRKRRRRGGKNKRRKKMKEKRKKGKTGALLNDETRNTRAYREGIPHVHSLSLEDGKETSSWRSSEKSPSPQRTGDERE